MKKIFSILTIVSFFVIFLAPIAASAAEDIPDEITKCKMRYDLTGTEWAGKGFTCAPKGENCPFVNPATGLGSDYTCGICCAMDTIYTVTGWIFVGVVVIAMIMMLIGAFNIMTAGGSPEKVNTGRNYIIFAVVGLIIALIAKVIPMIARNIFGM